MESVERLKLHRQLISQEDRPCARCGRRYVRRIHRLVPRLGYVLDNIMVLCHSCHTKIYHYQGKFQVGDVVYLNGRTPACIDLARHRPRRGKAGRDDPARQANLYILGSNGRGACEGEPPKDGYSAHPFRSYQLHPWPARGPQSGRPRKVKRAYKRHGTTRTSTGAKEGLS